MQVPAKPLPMNYSMATATAKPSVVQRATNSLERLHMVDPILNEIAAD
jgi:hypothetical protein